MLLVTTSCSNAVGITDQGYFHNTLDSANTFNSCLDIPSSSASISSLCSPINGALLDIAQGEPLNIAAGPG